MTKAQIALVAALVFPIHANASSEEVVNTVRQLCQAPGESGSHLRVSGGGAAEGSVRVKLLGVIGANANVEFDKSEWEGVQAVLREHQAGELANYRDCVRELTPLFLKASSSDSDSGRNATKAPNSRSNTALNQGHHGKIGTYLGESLNKAGYKRGATTIDILQIDDANRIRARITWSRGLYGSGSFKGTMEENGVVELFGTVLSDVSGNWDCDVSARFLDDDTLEGTYRLYPKAGNANGTQDGEFTVRK